jgi:hypothetical protein
LDFGLPVVWSQFFIWSIFIFWPSICPCTVFTSVFWTHPIRFNFLACCWVWWRKYTPWTVPNTSKSHERNDSFGLLAKSLLVVAASERQDTKIIF